jgi:monofunctional biosynthetic peptidoglycan transglycosylase
MIRNAGKWLWRWTKRLVIIFFAASVVSALLFRFVPVPVTPLMLVRCLEQWRDPAKQVKLEKHWVAYEDISPAMKLAVVAAEDQNFEEHYGFDFDAIRKAQQYNERHHGKRMRGASTISQQTAKNVFLWPARSWFRKGLEVYFTFLIEVCWSKQRILEVYLNVIETGEGLYGVDAAASAYFHTTATRLSVRQSALIAAILPNPRKWNAARPGPYIQRRQQRIVQAMSRLPAIDL